MDVTVAIAPRTKSFVKEIKEGEDTVDPLAEEKVAFLQQAGRNEIVDFPCYADRYPIEMLEYLRLMKMTKKNTKTLLAFFVACRQPSLQFEHKNNK